MLQITKTRQTTAEFRVADGKETKLVKTTVINTGADAVSTTYETLHESELYAKYRREMRQDEQKLRELRYAIEDAILDELETAENVEQE